MQNKPGVDLDTFIHSNLFDELTESELKIVAEVAIRREFNRGEVVIRENEKAFSLFVVEAGAAEVIKRTEGGQPSSVSRLERGNIFGEMSYFGDPFRTADIVACESLTLIEFPFEKLLQIGNQCPPLGMKINKVISSSINRKLTRTTDHLIDLLISSRLIALGQMAGYIVHEINNPICLLEIKIGQLEEILAEGESDPAILKEAVPTLRKGLDRIENIIKGVKSILRDPKDNPTEPISLGNLIEDTLDFCHEKFRTGGVTLQVASVPKGLLIRCNPVEISQIILNLLNNAYDAVEALDDQWVSLSCDVLETEVRISVTDSGSGIPEKVLEKLFQPFFTTKPIGMGTGLGLSISKRLAEANGGSLNVDQSGPNTRFRLTLPKAVG